MSFAGFRAASINFVITTGMSLSALWSQPGISKFTDIAQVTYGFVMIGGILAAAQTYKERMKNAPDEPI
jgi:hypothetical protein